MGLISSPVSPALADDDEYVAINLGSIGGGDAIRAHGINAAGEVVGEITILGEEQAFIWLPDDAYSLPAGMHLLDDTIPGFERSVAYDINDAGVVVGSVTADGVMRPYIWDLTGVFGSGFVINGSDTDGAAAFDINNDLSPLIVGSTVSSGSLSPEGVYDPRFTGGNHDGFVYTLNPGAPPVFTTLDSAGVNKFSIALAISDTDAIDGWRAGGMMSCPLTIVCFIDACQSQADGLYWENSTTADPLQVIALCDTMSIPRTVGFAVSDDRLVVGFGNNPNDREGGVNGSTRRWAMVWDDGPDAAPTLLKKLATDPVDDETAAYDVRTPSFGPMEIVGHSFENSVALLWRHNGSDWDDDPIDLNGAACTAGVFGSLRRATGINEGGWICGWGSAPGGTRSYVLIPADDYHENWCVADIANEDAECPDGVVNVFDLLALNANWGMDGPGAAISSDGGGPDVVDIFDLLGLLDAWDCRIGAGPG